MQMIKTAIGYLEVNSEAGVLKSIRFCDESDSAPVDASAIAQEISYYFDDARYRPDIRLEPEGTAFQRKVWAALREIPSGTVVTYGELARKLGSSPRAVGNACRANPIPVVIPCHRVVAANGAGGYMGQTQGAQMSVKHWLLRHEGVRI